MSKIILFIIIFGMIYLGVRKIWRDWTAQFRKVDDEKKQRDKQERKRPDVMDLRRDDDGVFRPPSSRKTPDDKD